MGKAVRGDAIWDTEIRNLLNKVVAHFGLEAALFKNLGRKLARDIDYHFSRVAASARRWCDIKAEQRSMKKGKDRVRHAHNQEPQ